MDRLRLFICSILLVLSSGCTTISDKINEEWPPITSYDQRNMVVNKASQIISDPHFQADFVANLTEQAIQTHSQKSIDEYIKQISLVSVDGLSEIKVHRAEFRFINQAIRFHVEMAFTIDALKLPVLASAEGDVAVENGTNMVRLRPALSHIKLSPANKVREWWNFRHQLNHGLISGTSALLKQYINNVNGEAFKQGIEIHYSVNALKHFSPKDVASKPNVQVSGNDIEVTFDTLPNAVSFVNDNGLLIIASTKAVAEPDIEVVGSVSETEFEENNQRYRAAVEKVLGDSFGQANYLNRSETGALIRSGYLASKINETLDDMRISIKLSNFLQVPDPNKPVGHNTFFQDIAVHDKQSLPKCTGLRKPFRGEKCDDPCHYPYDSCNSGCNLSNCDYGCKWSRPDRCAREAACKVERETRRAVCQARDASCKLEQDVRRENCSRKNTECKVSREAARVLHDAENEARVAKCNTDRLALKLVDGLVKLGEIHGEYWVDNSQLSSTITKIAVSEDISKASITSDIDAGLDTRLRVWINPEGIGHLACLFSFRKTLETHATFSQPNRVINADIHTRKNDKGGIELVAVTEPQLIKASLSPSPYQQLVDDDGFNLNCTFLSIGLPIVAGTQLLKEGRLGDGLASMFGRARITLDSQEFKFEIQPIDISLMESNIRLLPEWEEKSIGFTVKD